MPAFKEGLLSLLLTAPAIISALSCPPQGPVFPVPTGLNSKHPGIVHLTKVLNTKIEKQLHVLAGPPFNDTFTSFSVAITSLDKTFYEYHYTAPKLAPGSTRKVTGDTGYRIASISKSVTTLAALLQGKCMDDPITKYVPELSKGPNRGGVDWSAITLKDLASHLSGVARDYASFDAVDYVDPLTAMAFGLPPVDRNSFAPCGRGPADKPCTREQFFEGMKQRPAIYHPADRASYSNLAFSLLGYAIETITGKSYEQVIQEQIFKPLGMTRSTTKLPVNGTGVVPAIPNDWFYDGGHVNAAGGIYSTTNDLSKYLRGIMGYKILPGHITRNWYKPVTFSASPNSALGMPWEIYRTDKKSNVTSDGRVIDIITKAGGVRAYTSFVIMVPEFGYGITILTAGMGLASPALFELTIQESIRAFDSIARQEANKTYPGTYSTGKGGELRTNVTLVVDGGPGIRIKSFFSRNVNFLDTLMFVATQGEPGVKGEVEARLFPTGVVDKDGGERWRLAFEFHPDEETLKKANDSLGTAQRGARALFNEGVCVAQADSYTWAGKPLTEFVFRRKNNHGAIIGLDLTGLRVSLDKVV